MNNIMSCLQLSPLNPLKGKITSNIVRANLVTITPLRGLGVNKYNNKLLP
jgi:hypothetical protein